MVSGFFTSPCDQSRIFCGDASLIRIASNVMGFGMPIEDAPQVLGQACPL